MSVDVLPARLDAGVLVQRYEALLQISDAISTQHELPTLLRDVARRLPLVVPFDALGVVLRDSGRHRDRLFLLENSVDESLGPELARLPLDASASPAAVVLDTQRPLIVGTCEHDHRFPAVTGLLHRLGLGSYCLLPLTSAMRRIGVIGFGSRQPGAYEAADLEFLQRVANQVAVAVDNAQNHARVEQHHRLVAAERDRWRALVEITNALVANLELPQLFEAITACLRRVIQHDFAALALHEPGSPEMKIYASDLGGATPPEPAPPELLTIPLEGSAPGLAFTTRQPLLLNSPDPGQFPSAFTRRLYELGVRSGCCLPLTTRHRTLGTLNLASRREGHFSQRDLDLLIEVAGQVAIAVENALAFREIEQLNTRLAEEKLYLEDEIRSHYDFEEIVGDSPGLKQALALVETVAPTDSSVIILGETGTGKELVARALHELSARRRRTLVKVNCAAIPSGLLESELFGHEKGAFTGAIEQKVGRFELAHQGTLFLDEVGDIPLELQPKLLRVLQEHEFERLGSSRSIRVDVRIVAATNRHLPQLVADRQFRSDLFYRLNVFPILVPPLRERPADIPVLVRYFTQKFARRTRKRIDAIPAATMETLCRWPWPGNVRELENVIERAVILTRGTSLDVPLSEFATPAVDLIPDDRVRLDAVERDHIVRVLDACHWVVGGPRGAATQLGLKRTTLASRMEKLGISRPQRQG